MFKDPRLALIYGITFIDAVITGGMGPLFNKYTQDLPARTVWVMAGSALLLGLQLVCSPVLGAISDKRGRKPVLIGTAIGSLLASLFLFPVKAWGYLSNRAFEGTTNGMTSVLRSAVVDIADKKDLVQQTAVQGSITALGAIFGPAVGGVLIIMLPQARYDPQPIVIMLVVLAFVNIGLTLIFRETCPSDTEPLDRAELKEKAINAVKVKTLWKQLAEVDEQLKGFKSIYILQLLSLAALGYYNYFIAYLVTGDLGLTPRQASYFFIYHGLLNLTVNLVFFQTIVKYVNQRKLLIAVSLAGIGTMALYAFAGNSLTMLYVAGAADALTVGLLAGLISGLMSKIVAKSDGQGSLFGNTQALGGVASFATAVATTALTALEPRAPFAFYALAMSVLAFRVMRLPEEAAKEAEAKPQEIE